MAATADAGQMVYMNVRDEVYIDDELNSREESRHTAEEIEQLAASIEEANGLLQPIGVRRTPKIRQTEHDKPYELKYGFGRVKALTRLAETTGDERWVTHVPVIAKEDESPIRGKVDQLVENLLRKGMTNMETARTFRMLLDDDKELTQTDLHRMTGWPKATISNYVRMTDLDSSVQDLIAQSKLSWSNGREIEALRLPAEEQKQLAALGADMTPEKFRAHLIKTYPEKFKQEGDTTVSTGNGEATAATGTQKLDQSIRANVVKEKYLPHFEEQATKAKGPEKVKWETRVDAAKFFLKQQGTSLAAELQPWEEKLEKEAEAQKVAEKEATARKMYIRKSVTAIETELKSIPPAFLENGKPNPKREMPTLPSALAKVKESVVSALAEGKKAGLPEKHIRSSDDKDAVSFPVPDVEAFMADITKAHAEHLEKKARDNAAREKARKDKEAAEKAKAEAAGQPEAANAPAAEKQAVTA